MTVSETDIELNFGKPIPKAEIGTYPAILTGIEPFKINEGTADAKTLLRWDFMLAGLEDPEVPGQSLILDGVTSMATGPRSKMRAWVTALLGRGLDEKIGLTGLRTQLVNKECFVQVGINDDGYSRVENVVPPARKPATPPATQPGEFSGAPTTPPMTAPGGAAAGDELGF
jgi:hypothetical protein